MKSSRGSGVILDQVSVSPTSVSQMVELENDQICLDSLANVVEDMTISVEQVQGGSNGGSGVAPSGCKTADQEDLGSSGDGANAAISSATVSDRHTVSFAQKLDNVIEPDLVYEQLKVMHKHQFWYSRHDFVSMEEEACSCTQSLQAQAESHGILDSDLDNIIGLEKRLLSDVYVNRRDALIKAVMDEQNIQWLAKRFRSERQGCYDGSDDSISNSEDISLIQLANTSERFSLWARDQASLAAFTLEHDLALSRTQQEDVEAIES